MSRFIRFLRGWWHHHVSYENGWQCSHIEGGGPIGRFCQRADGHYGEHRYK